MTEFVPKLHHVSMYCSTREAAAAVLCAFSDAFPSLRGVTLAALEAAYEGDQDEIQSQLAAASCEGEWPGSLEWVTDPVALGSQPTVTHIRVSPYVGDRWVDCRPTRTGWEFRITYGRPSLFAASEIISLVVNPPDDVQIAEVVWAYEPAVLYRTIGGIQERADTIPPQIRSLIRCD